MNELNFLEKLLDGIDVQWKTIGEVTSQTSNIKWREAKRSYRYVDLTAVDIETKKITVTTEITANNAPSRAQKLLQENDVIFATTRPTQQRFCLIDGEHSDEVASTGYCVLRAKQDEVLPKWILHWISTGYFKQYVEENQSGSAYPAISDAKVKECLIPIPCPDNKENSLAIQSEIVRILDKFTALTTVLTAELTARKKQYNYYCDQLLNFDENIPVVQLSDCCVSISDGDHQAPPKTDSGVPFITISNITSSNTIDFENTHFVPDDYYQKIHDKRKARKKDVLYTVVGSIGIPVYIDCDMKLAFQRHIAILRADEKKIIPKYLYHVMRSSDFLKKSNSVAVGAAQKTITLSALNKMNISIPPLGEQERIVNILDKFDTLVNSISEGLPREIELRQKQYEYYRDMLFSFPKPEVAEA